MKNIAREVIAIDRIARKKIELLETEKKGLGEFLKKEKEIRLNQVKEEVLQEISEAEASNHKDIKAKEKLANKELEEKGAIMQARFAEKKDEWVELIFNEIIK